jgi:hypothetical protein
MRTVESAIMIDAPPSEVWRVLTAAEEYQLWNPFITRVAGELTAGSRPAVTITPPGRRPMTFRPRVVAAQPGRELSWKGSVGVPGVCDGHHQFTLTPAGDGSTRLVQREQFRGLLVPFVGAMIEPTRRGFASMNEALRRRVESRAGAR